MKKDKNRFDWINKLDDSEIQRLLSDEKLPFQLSEWTKTKVLNMIKNSDEIVKEKKVGSFINFKPFLKVVFSLMIIVVIFVSFFTTVTILKNYQFGRKNITNCIVQYIKGDSYLIDEETGKKKELKVGYRLDENSIIVTGSGANVELGLDDKSIVFIKENSKLKVAKLFKDNEIKNTLFYLIIGEIFCKPEKQTPGSSFEINTRSITAGVRGTEFYVKSTEQNDITVNVVEGEVYAKLNATQDIIDTVNILNKGSIEKINSLFNEEVGINSGQILNVKYKDSLDANEQRLEIINSIKANIEKDPKYLIEEKIINDLIEIQDKVLNISDLDKEEQELLNKDTLTIKETETKKQSKFSNKMFREKLIKSKNYGVLIEAEDYINEYNGQVQVIYDRPGISGGIINYWNLKGHTLEWEFDIDTEQEYMILFRYAQGRDYDCYRTIYIDGNIPTDVFNKARFKITGGWGRNKNEWQNFTISNENKETALVKLTKGKHVLKIVNEGGLSDDGPVNLDYIAILSVGAKPEDFLNNTKKLTTSKNYNRTNKLELIENFDNVEIGKIPDGWRLLGDSETLAQVVDTRTIKPYSSPNCLKLYDNSLKGNIQFIRDIGLHDYGQLKFYFYGTNKLKSTLFVYLNDSSGNYLFNIQFRHDQGIKLYSPSGEIVLVGTYNFNKWNEVLIKYDSLTGFYQLDLNGKTLGIYGLLGDQKPFKLSFQGGRTKPMEDNKPVTDITVYIDDIEFTTKKVKITP